MPLSAAEKQRRYRERKRAEEEARRRYDRGLPAEAAEPVAPDGAWLSITGHPRPKGGHYDAADGTFPPIPEDILTQTYTAADGSEDIIPETYARFLAVQREAPTSASVDALFEV
jgi:hypothetical protein